MAETGLGQDVLRRIEDCRGGVECGRNGGEGGLGLAARGFSVGRKRIGEEMTL